MPPITLGVILLLAAARLAVIEVHRRNDRDHRREPTARRSAHEDVHHAASGREHRELVATPDTASGLRVCTGVIRAMRGLTRRPCEW